MRQGFRLHLEAWQNMNTESGGTSITNASCRVAHERVAALVRV
jgi:hypothetical protein